MSTLKERISQVIAEVEAERSRLAAEHLRQLARQEELNRAKAERVVERICEQARTALMAAEPNKAVNICLIEDDSITTTLDALGGVGAAVRDRITAEGLKFALWIDVDTSGGARVRNRLMLRIK